MKQITKTFHFISYLSYPALAGALFFVYRPFMLGLEDGAEDISFGLMFGGLALSLLSLKETHNQSKLEKFVYNRPLLSRSYILILLLIMLGGCFMGLIGYYRIEDLAKRQMSIGLFTFCIGGFAFIKMFIGLLKDHEQRKARETDQ